ncbi:MAG: hypothetical protein MHPSP_004528, partial [Paramarteilia canceri]
NDKLAKHAILTAYSCGVFLAITMNEINKKIIISADKIMDLRIISDVWCLDSKNKNF